MESFDKENGSLKVFARTNRNCYLCLQRKRKCPLFFLMQCTICLGIMKYIVSDLGVV